jgi:predicted nucleic acid-binding protein
MPAGPTVTNTSCLIALERIGRLHLLEQLYGPLVVPVAVAREWGVSPLLPWIQAQAVQNVSLVQALCNQLGPGESEAIALALELSAVQVILDEKKARQMAQQFGLPVSGTLALVLHAKERGLIPTVRTVLDDLLATGFRISDALFQETLRQAGE